MSNSIKLVFDKETNTHVYLKIDEITEVAICRMADDIHRMAHNVEEVVATHNDKQIFKAQKKIKE